MNTISQRRRQQDEPKENESTNSTADSKNGTFKITPLKILSWYVKNS